MKETHPIQESFMQRQHNGFAPCDTSATHIVKPISQNHKSLRYLSQQAKTSNLSVSKAFFKYAIKKR